MGEVIDAISEIVWFFLFLILSGAFGWNGAFLAVGLMIVSELQKIRKEVKGRR